MEDFRDTLGRFKSNYNSNNIPVESKIKRMYSLQESWKKRKDYIGDIKNKNPKIYNSWRAFMFTKRGKKIGHSEEWNNFRTFYNDVVTTYKEGLVFRRLDISKPFSKDNFIWIKTSEEALLHDKLATLTYKGETLPLHALADKYNVSISGLRNRYFKHKDSYTVEEIIFGKLKNRGSKTIKDASTKSEKRIKASKMLSSYRLKDKKNNTEICDYTIDEMIDVMSSPCIYCGDSHRIGLDRIDNSRGHTKDNTVPCCYECNCARNNNFTFEEMKLIGSTIKTIKENRKNNKK